MTYTCKIFVKARISLVLLLLLSVRLIPFNLLHYHNSQFASYEIYSGSVSLWYLPETISDDSSSCSFDKFLSLTGTGFVLEIEGALIEPVIHDIAITSISELRSTLLLVHILNKGSPQLV